MNVVDVPVDLIDPSPVNPNRMTDAKYLALVAAIRSPKVGFLQPTVVEGPRPDGRYTMRDGHHRLRACQELGHATIPSVVVSPGDGVGAIMLALNNIRGELDLAASADIILELSAAGWDTDDLETTGFTAQEISDLIAATEEATPDDVLGGGPGDSFEDLDAEEPSGSARPFVLELTFTDAVTYRKVRKALRRAAGKGNPLATGLVKVLALDDR